MGTDVYLHLTQHEQLYCKYNCGTPDYSTVSKWFQTKVDKLKASFSDVQRKIPFKHIGVLRSSFCFSVMPCR
jgi:hypothetical protein